MNERIRELMGNTLDEKFSGTWSTMDMQDLTKFSERFAELIIRECLSKVNEAVYAREMSGRYYPDSDGKKILKHFGVEK